MIDSATVTVEGGKGGDGLVSFLREKFRPKGGPDGGDGGNGGDVIFIADSRLATLTNFRRIKKFKAQNGEDGKKKKMHGKNGSDLILYVPVGTEIYELRNGRWVKVYDLDREAAKFLAAKGGVGGWGNVHFATAENRAPRKANSGKKGVKKKLKLNLKLIADLGIIGLPNVGKSTLISTISNCRPKIGDYNFTTIEPNLGVVKHKGVNFIAADIPGLISGAHKGRGLGDKFLKHIERTKILLHLISSDSSNYEKDYQTVRNELRKFNGDLVKKRELIAVSKVDLADNLDKKFIKSKKPFLISAYDRKSISNLLDKVVEELGG